jgi:hypothetical protein
MTTSQLSKLTGKIHQILVDDGGDYEIAMPIVNVVYDHLLLPWLNQARLDCVIHTACLDEIQPILRKLFTTCGQQERVHVPETPQSKG